MRPRILQLLVSALLLVTLVQCEDSLTEITEQEELETPTLVTPENNSEQPTDISLEWDELEGAETYEIRVSEAEDFSSTIVNTTQESNSLEILDLPSNTTIYWQVRPNTEQQQGPWSETWSFSTISDSNEGSEAASTNLKSPEDGSNNRDHDLTLEWASVASASAYKVQVATDENFNNIVVDESVESSSYKANLDYDNTYFWRVEPVVDGRQSQWTDAFSFTTSAEGNKEEPPASSDNGFVSVKDGDFVLDGETYRFAGTNAYYLPTYEKINSREVDQALDAFAEAEIKVIRMWGFYDGQPQFNGDITLQPEPGVYNEEDLQRLDNVVAKAKDRGIKVVLTLLNNWPELGGVPQYNAWDGNPGGGMSHFISDEDTQKWFKDYISMLLNRTNTVTGVKYKDETSIFSWEIIGEARNPGANPEDLRDWYQDIAQHIKSEDSNHMVSTGEEGFEVSAPNDYSLDQYSNQYVLRSDQGTSYKMNTAIPEIDYGTAHWYPEVWGLSGTDFDAQHAWISDHAKIAEDLGKPFLLGEWGDDHGYGDSNQRAMYDDLYDHAESIELDGSLIWQFTATGTKCYEFGGNICWPGGRQDEGLYNSFYDHIQTMNNSK